MSGPLPESRCRCKACEHLQELYKATDKSNRLYWAMTELFVLFHGGDECRPGQADAPDAELTSDCCGAPPASTIIDGTALCTRCKEWSEFLPEEEETATIDNRKGATA